jgi:hypothetical protein
MAVGPPEVQAAPPSDRELRQRKRDVRARYRGDYAELGQLDAGERRDGQRPDHEATDCTDSEPSHGMTVRVAAAIELVSVAAIDGLPRIPGDLEDHGRDQETDERVGDRHP